MTIYELSFLIGAAVIFFGIFTMGCLAENCRDLGEAFCVSFALTFFYMLIGGLVSIGFTIAYFDDYRETARVAVKPISQTLTSDGLDVVMDDHEHILFKEHSDVEKWKNGATIYRVYEFVQVPFGDDLERTFIKLECNTTQASEVETAPR